MKKWLFVLVTTLFALVLVACTANEDAGTDKSQEKDGGDTDTQETGEKTLYINNDQEPTSFDPSMGFDSVSWDPLNQIMEGLMRLDENFEPQEAIAESYEVSDDGLTYTFTLRDTTWTNGDPVTADDFVYGWLHMLDPETASYSAFLGTNYIEGGEEYNAGEIDAEDVGIKALDDKTLEVNLVYPLDSFLGLITLPTFFPVNEAVASENEQWYAEADTFVGNGPFKMESWNHDEDISMVKNEDYWDADNVALDRIEWAMVNSDNTEYQMYQTGELDIASIPTEMAEELLDDPEAIVFDEAGTQFYRFNVTKEPFTNKKIRQAFTLALDPEEIVDYVVKTGNKVARGFVSYGFPGPDGEDFRDAQGDLIEFNPEEAKKLLQEGMEEEGWDELPAVELSFNTDDVLKDVAETIQDQLKENIDVEVTLQNSEWNVFRDDQADLKLQFSRSTFGHDYADPINALENFTTSNTVMNRTGWSNEEYDKLLDDARKEADSEKRWDMLLEAERILIDEAPLLPLYFYSGAALQKENVKNIVRPPVGSIELKYADKE
ncbi:MAG TPA: peptide ABC transporter substrate-binding protein [Bacillota bacterium]|nr:peptide ABC transporter substrate-binding protein [Bacillota bacterium]